MLRLSKHSGLLDFEHSLNHFNFYQGMWALKVCTDHNYKDRHSELAEESRVLTLGYCSSISTRDSSASSE